MIKDLLFLYDRNLAYAKKLVADVDEEKMAYQPAPGMNHPAWTLGHLARTGDVLLSMFDQAPLSPPQWKELHGRDSKPSADRSVYASKKDLVEALERSHEAVKAVLSHVDPKELEGPPPAPYATRFPTKWTLLIHMMTGHEQVHLGQLSAWRRVQGMGAV
jgi:uncharacterized damage-inducible protein DinB